MTTSTHPPGRTASRIPIQYAPARHWSGNSGSGIKGNRSRKPPLGWAFLPTQETHRISLTVPPSLVWLTEFLDNLVHLIFAVLWKVCTILYLLWWWMPRPLGCGSNAAFNPPGWRDVSPRPKEVQCTARPGRPRPQLLAPIWSFTAVCLSIWCWARARGERWDLVGSWAEYGSRMAEFRALHALLRVFGSRRLAGGLLAEGDC